MIEHVQRRAPVSLRDPSGRGSVGGDFVRQMLVSPPSSGEGVPGQLVLVGARIEGELNLAGLTVDGIAAFIDCEFTGRINMEAATVGTFVIQDSALCRLSAIGLHARDLQISGSSISDGLSVQSGRFSGNFELRRSRVSPQADRDFAMFADRLIVEGNLVLDGSDIRGGLTLHSAQVGGTLAMRQTSLTSLPGRSGQAIQAPGLTVGAALFAESARIDGVVFMPGAVVRADLDFSDATLSCASGGGSDTPALQLDKGSIGGDLRINGSLVGGMHAVGCRIEGSLNLDGCQLGSAASGDVLTLDQIVVGQSLFMRSGFSASGRIKMTAASLGLLAIDLDAWPPEARVELTDAIVRGTEPSLSSHRQESQSGRKQDSNLHRWVAWVDRYAEPVPMGLFEQFAAQCQAIGHDADARRLRHAAEIRRTDSDGKFGRAWGTFLDVTVGYGYRPQLALIWLALYLVVGSIFYACNPLTPVKADESLTWDPRLYTLDVLVPLVDLGYANSFQTSGLTKLGMIVLMVVGWFLVAAVIAGASRILSKK